MGGLLVVLHLPLGEALFFVYSTAVFPALLTNCAQEKDYAVWNGREQEKRRRLASQPVEKGPAKAGLFLMYEL